MSTKITKTALLFALAAGTAVLAGCGGSTDNAPAPAAASSAASSTEAATGGTAPDTSTPEGKAEADSVKSENLMADCMKRAGFKYVPHPMRYAVSKSNIAGIDPALTSYEALKAYRQKYGYGTGYAKDVFPNDPAVAVPVNPPNPNNAIRAALPAAQQTAYDTAYGAPRELSYADAKKPQGGCIAEVNRQMGNTGGESKSDAGQQAAAREASQRFETDSRVLAAAQDYGSCLRRKGYAVPSTKPGVVEHTLSQAAQQEYDSNPAASKQQGLSKEIKTSLDDLECGKAYEAVAKPFVQALLQAGVG
ncbi:hypothetical protein QRX50_26475 [Amycolatopsis carbonis]|uniref:Uncharacterized protein n=1 Tax=Amycolatopsis carbonis TaxID=715471 RepID=A0A9Y2I9X7_9PSEU|nr:hypothetical protein [Amycolatopsis sp. 2-15]WIX75096.1 hypothetical protein QRX50_26475 [Amycolatopsis sp. 2-15]